MKKNNIDKILRWTVLTIVLTTKIRKTELCVTKTKKNQKLIPHNCRVFNSELEHVIDDESSRWEKNTTIPE